MRIEDNADQGENITRAKHFRAWPSSRWRRSPQSATTSAAASETETCRRSAAGSKTAAVEPSRRWRRCHFVIGGGSQVCKNSRKTTVSVWNEWLSASGKWRGTTVSTNFWTRGPITYRTDGTSRRWTTEKERIQ